MGYVESKNGCPNGFFEKFLNPCIFSIVSFLGNFLNVSNLEFMNFNNS